MVLVVDGSLLVMVVVMMVFINDNVDGTHNDNSRYFDIVKYF